MQSKKTARRRGTSIAAAAMSLALVAPFAQPVASAQPLDPVVSPAPADPNAGAAADGAAGTLEEDWLSENNGEANRAAGSYAPGANEDGWRHVYWAQRGRAGQTQPTLVDSTPRVYDVDAIESGQITRSSNMSDSWGAGKDVVSGRAVIVTPRQGGQMTSTYTGFKPVPDSVPIYMQWIDSDGSRSPIYRTKTHRIEQGVAGQSGEGIYAFAVPEWVDASGKVHRFVAAVNQRYRVWADPAPHDFGAEPNPGAPEGTFASGTNNELVPIRTTGAGYPGAFGIGSGSALGEFPGSAGTNGNMQRTGVWFYERPYATGESAKNYMKAAPQEQSVKLVAVMNAQKPESKLIEDPFGPVRSPGAHRDPVWKRTVSGTVWHESGNNNQLFNVGDRVGDARATGTQGYRVFATALTPEGTTAYDTQVDSLDPWARAERTKQFVAEHPEYVAGTVWTNAIDENGDYTLRFPESLFPGAGQKYEQQGIPDQFQNHLYVWVEDEDGNVVAAATNYSQPEFIDPNRNTQWNPTAIPAVLNSFGYKRIYNMNMALVKDPDLELNITDYNNTTNPAKRGDTAHVQIDGQDTLPVGARVEWRRGAPNGPIVKSCTIVSKTNLTDVKDPSKNCGELLVPNDANHGEFFYAALVNGGATGAPQIAVDSFIVLVDGPAWADTKEAPNDQSVKTLANIGKQDPSSFPKYPDVEVYDKDGKLLPKDAVGVTIDPASGALSFDPKDQSTAPGEKYTVKVYDKKPVVDPQTGQPVTDPVTGEIVFETAPESRRFIDDATVSYIAQRDEYDAVYNTYVYATTGSWGRADEKLKPQFVETATGAGISQSDMDKFLKPSGTDGKRLSQAFTIDPEYLAANGWNLKTRTRDVTNRGDITIDSWGDGAHPDRRGNITFIPPADAQVGDVYELPVTVTYADGTQEKTTARIEIVDSVANVYDVTYGEVVARAGGADVTVPPVVTDPDGNEGSAPQGTKFAVDSSFVEPEGYTVRIDENTGVITVTPPAEATDATRTRFEVPVVVTYPRVNFNGTNLPAGSQDRASATVLLDSDGDGIPDERDVKVTPQEQTKPEFEAIDPITVTPGDDKARITVDAPKGLEWDEATKQVTGTPEITDWEVGEVERILPVEVTVENPDGSTASETAYVTVRRDQTPHIVDGTEVETVKAGADDPTALDDHVQNPNDTLTGEVHDRDGEKIEGAEVTIDPVTGAITVKVPGTAKHGDGQVIIKDANNQPIDDPIKIKIDNSVPATPLTPAIPVTTVGGTANEVKPTDEQQGTGIKVENPGGTTVVATDEDGKSIPVVIDPESGEVKVIPGEDVDGPITVTIIDSDLPGGKVEVTVPVEGHTEGVDDNNKSNQGPKTTVDDSNVTPVKPTDEQQGTGIKVENPGGTTVVATDEDGKNIPVVIGKDGEVFVTPGTGVDGPITVTIVDPDLPGGSVTVTVPVEGHTEGVDDNSSEPNNGEGSSKTSVDSSDVKDVQPTGKEQDTNITVINPGGTSVVAKDKDGNDVPARIDKDGKVWVTPGEGVNGPITVTIIDSDLPDGKVTVEVPVEGRENPAPKPDSSSSLSDAERGRCVATAVGLGLPLLALIPIGLATQVAIPGISPVVQDVSKRIGDANVQLQQQLGIFNPQLAGQIASVNDQLRGFGADVVKVGGALALIAAGILGTALLVKNCTPGEGSSVSGSSRN